MTGREKTIRQSIKEIRITVMRKFRSGSGESIAEVLVAALVVALGALLLVTMVLAATRIIRNSEKAYNEYLDERNVVESGNSEFSPKNVTDEEAGTGITIDKDSKDVSLKAEVSGALANPKNPNFDTNLNNAVTITGYKKDGTIQFVTLEPGKIVAQTTTEQSGSGQTEGQSETGQTEGQPQTEQTPTP